MTELPFLKRFGFAEAEIPAIGIVDKRQYAFGSEPADEFGLVFNHAPVPLFYLVEFAFAFCQFFIIGAKFLFRCGELLVGGMEIFMRALQFSFSFFLPGDVPSDRLVLDYFAIGIEDCPVAPLLPPDFPVRHDDPVFDRTDRFFPGKCPDMLLYLDPVFFGQGDELPFLKSFGFTHPEIPAIGIVDKCQYAFRSEPADEFGLVFNHALVPLFYFMEFAFAFCQFFIIGAEFLFRCGELLVGGMEIFVHVPQFIGRFFLLGENQY